jgi:hypothetical protein
MHRPLLYMGAVRTFRVLCVLLSTCITWSQESLDAHCSVCGCAVNRRFKPFPKARAPKTKAQGRPLGLLLAFLSCECTGDQDAHRGMLQELPHAVRLSARLKAAGDPDASPLFAVERHPNDGDVGGEPIVTLGGP